MVMQDTVMHWFRADLRLADNPALSLAAASGMPLICAFVLDDDAAGDWAPGGAGRWWLHHSLAALQESLRAHGGDLLLARGDTADVLAGLIRDHGVTDLHWNRVNEPWALRLDERVRARCGDDVEISISEGQLLVDPGEMRTGQGKPFRVFTPFWKHLQTLEAPPEPLPVPPLEDTVLATGGEHLDDWSLCPSQPDWAAGFSERWQPGESAALQRLETFLEQRVRHYSDQRDIPADHGTSRLSPHLHFGEISPAQVWHLTRFALAGNARDEKGGMAFLRELAWREFSLHLLHHWPSMPDTALRPQFAGFPWRNDPQLLAAWQQGRTGYPLVDAGMRELWATGWMHNRVRMVTASFLVKHLLIRWQQGEAWFWDTLVDADLANNSASWQWVAGCGTDAAPYFRIFNPTIQARKFDPAGDYIRRWVPELEALDAGAIHEPWLHGGAAGYPEPIVDHATARQEALDAFEAIRNAA